MRTAAAAAQERAFYAGTAHAERDGLRPCKRCHAAAYGDAMTKKVERACRYIETHLGEDLRLSSLSRQVGASPFHLQRRFKGIVGMTPKEYAEACRLKSFKRELREGSSVTAAIYDAGFGSSSRVYERVGTRLGMTPKQYRRGGKGVGISYALSETSLGVLLLAATDRGLCSVQIGHDPAALIAQLAKEYPEAVISQSGAENRVALRTWIAALSDYLEGTANSLDLPLDIRGTAFQMKVWKYLMQIPYGEVRSYAEVAKGIGQPAASRAVGAACGANPVALVVPCHRVLRGDGSLGGYRWGLERKRTLIDRERATR